MDDFYKAVYLFVQWVYERPVEVIGSVAFLGFMLLVELHAFAKAGFIVLILITFVGSFYHYCSERW